MDEFLFYYKKVLANFKNFDGRARRKEYWMFVAVNIVVSIAFSILSSISYRFGGILSMLYTLAILVPSIAVAIRRLHDIGKSGWLVLFSLVPLVGWVILILWACQPGQTGANEYGLDPKDTPEAIDNADNNLFN